LTEGNIHL